MNRVVRAAAAVVILPLIALGCEGPEGPMGPEGPQGPPGAQGPQGPAAEFEVLVRTGVVGGTGSSTLVFPGVQIEEAVVACWLSQDGQSVWLKIGTDLQGPTCGAGNQGSDLAVTIIDAPSGWWFMATVVAGQ